MQNQSLYGNYALFMALFDHSATIRLGAASNEASQRFDGTRKRFRKLCSEKNASMFPDTLRFSASLGYNDDIAFAAVDELSSIARAAGAMPEIESYTLALPFSSRIIPLTGPICDVKEFLTDGWNTSQTSLPLVSVTHVKLHGFATLTLGGRAQPSMAALVAQRATDVIAEIQQGLDSSSREWEELFKGALPPRVAVLDPVEAEDLLVLVFSNNYSIVASIIAAIRNIRFDDLYRESLELEEKLGIPNIEQDKSYSKLLSAFSQKDKNLSHKSTQPKSQAAALAQNGVVASTYSTLAVRCDLSGMGSLSDALSGKVAIAIRGDVAPSHEASTVNEAIGTWRSRHIESQQLSLDSHRMIVPGRHDVQIPSVREIEDGYFSVIALTDALKLVAHVIDSKRSAVVDVNSQFAVPIPKKGGAAATFNRLLELIEPGPDDGLAVVKRLGRLGANVRSRLGIDNFEELGSALSDIGVSASVISEMQRLMAEYALAIQDPLFFDLLIDLADSFLIFSEFPVEFVNEPEATRMSMGEARQTILELFDSIKQAFDLRLGRGSAKKEERLGDLRGSISNLISASDAATKCVAGVLRRGIYDDDEEFASSRHRVNGIVSHTLYSRPTLRSTLSRDMWLTIIYLDRDHVFEPEYLIRIVHELAHTYFSSLICAGPKDLYRDFAIRRDAQELPHWLNDDESLSRMYLRASELFADGVVREIVFGGDNAAFTSHQVAVIGTLFEEILVAKKRDTISGRRLDSAVEMLLRIFSINTLDERINDRCPAPEWAEEFCDFCQLHLRELMPKFDLSRQVERTYVKSRTLLFEEELAFYQRIVDEGIQHVKDVLGDGFLYAKEKPLDCDLVDYDDLEQQFRAGIPLPFAAKGKKFSEVIAVFRSLRFYASLVTGAKETASQNGSRDRATIFKAFVVTFKSLLHVSSLQRMRRAVEMLTEKTEILEGSQSETESDSVLRN